DIAAIQAVTDASSAGVATFVIGIGQDPLADQTLSQMAIAGGYPRSGGAYPFYYPVSSTTDLIATLDQLVAIARSCRIPLAAPIGFSTDAISVLGDGAQIPHDPSRANGWDYSDATHASVDLYGAACTSVTSGTVQRVSVVFQCPPAG